MQRLTRDRAGSRPTTAEPRAGSAGGWPTFAGVLLLLVGSLSVLEGVVAFRDDGFYLVRPNGFVITLDYVVWGWVQTISGVVFGVAGIGVLRGSMLARIAAVVLAGLAAVVNLVFIPAQPLWGSIIIACNILVLYALVVHDDE